LERAAGTPLSVFGGSRQWNEPLSNLVPGTKCGSLPGPVPSKAFLDESCHRFDPGADTTGAREQVTNPELRFESTQPEDARKVKTIGYEKRGCTALALAKRRHLAYTMTIEPLA
jgi:hypothetical protein